MDTAIKAITIRRGARGGRYSRVLDTLKTFEDRYGSATNAAVTFLLDHPEIKAATDGRSNGKSKS